MKAWHAWKGVVLASASVTACAAVLGFDSTPELSPYNAIVDTSGGHWQQSSVSPGQYFQGGAFDGRYVYLAPAEAALRGGFVQRYDTREAFGLASWSSFALSRVTGAGNSSFGGAEFDGRYVYFVPVWTGKPKAPDDSVFVRYDTTAPYDSDSSWEAFDVTQNVSTHVNGFFGGTFDGRYLYFAPSPSTYALRFDTHGAFSSRAAWEAFHIGAFDDTTLGMEGALFDGRYVYFVPFGGLAMSDYSDGLVRYDTRKGFADHTAWEMSHLGLLNPDASGFSGGAFDGRYVYLSPYDSFLGTVARFDTIAPGGLKAPGSWKFFSVEEHVNAHGAGFCGAGFDGRFVYFVPNVDVVASGLVVRVDSLGDFENKKSWSTFNMASIDPAASQFCGAVFDGTYMYFIPALTKLVTRFEARTSPEMPMLPGFFGSFL